MNKDTLRLLLIFLYLIKIHETITNIGYRYIESQTFKIDTIYEKTYLLNKFPFNDQLDCMVKCNALKDCLIVKIEEEKMCTIYNEIAFMYMLPSTDTILYEKLVNGSSKSRFNYKMENKFLPGLIHYWPMWGNTFDIIGGVHLINGVNSGLTLDRLNNTNSAVQFNNGYFALPSGFYLDASFTVTLWIRVIKISYHSRVLEFGNGPLQDNIIMSYTFDYSTKPYFFVNSNRLNSPLLSSTSLRLKVWEFLCFVFDENGLGKIYLNGIIVADGSLHVPSIIMRTQNFLGRSSWYPLDDDANADFDELKIYNRALNQDEIVKEMNDNMSYVIKF